MISVFQNYTKVTCIYIDGHKPQLFAQAYMEPFLELMSTSGYSAKYTNYWVCGENKSRSPRINVAKEKIRELGNDHLDYVVFYSNGVDAKINYSQCYSVLSWEKEKNHSSTFFFSKYSLGASSALIDFIFETEFKAAYIYTDYAERCPNCYKFGASFQNGNDENSDRFKSNDRIATWFNNLRNQNYDKSKQIRDIYEINIWSRDLYEHFLNYPEIKVMIFSSKYGQIKEHKNYYIWTIDVDYWDEITKNFDRNGLSTSSPN